jgi:hypothetical protein
MAPRYKHFKAETLDLSALAASKPRERKLSPRQLAALEREAEIKTALDQAAALPASQAYALHLADGEKMPNYRNAFLRVWSESPRRLNVAARGTTIYISAGKLPGKAWNLNGKGR